MPVDSFAENRFGLKQMVGNVWAWTEDCWHGNYKGAPTDSSLWTGGDCNSHVVRGGAWNGNPDKLRSANRQTGATSTRYGDLGFRVARTLSP